MAGKSPKNLDPTKGIGNPEESLAEAIGSAGGYDLLATAAEFSLDDFLGDGPLKDVPLVGSLIKIGKVGLSVRDHLFFKKVRRFLHSLESVPRVERESFADRLSHDPELKSKVGEKLLLLLERHDDVGKSEFLGCAFGAFLTSEVDFETFHRFARAIDRCMVDDLTFVHNFRRASDAFADRAADLVSCGLVEVVGVPTVAGPDVHAVYRLTPFGDEFVRIVLSRWELANPPEPPRYSTGAFKKKSR